MSSGSSYEVWRLLSGPTRSGGSYELPTRPGDPYEIHMKSVGLSEFPMRFEGPYEATIMYVGPHININNIFVNPKYDFFKMNQKNLTSTFNLD